MASDNVANWVYWRSSTAAETDAALRVAQASQKLKAALKKNPALKQKAQQGHMLGIKDVFSMLRYLKLEP